MDSLPDDRAEGERLRDEGLNHLRAHRARLIRECTAVALRVALDRGEVSADDVRALVTIPAGINPTFVGCVFRDLGDAGIIRRTGVYRPSIRPPAHARPNAVWRIADAHGAAAWLAAHPTI